jgi:hypothetical protein
MMTKDAYNSYGNPLPYFYIMTEEEKAQVEKLTTLWQKYWEYWDCHNSPNCIVLPKKESDAN